MQLTIQEFIAASKTIKEVFLKCLFANKPLCIKTTGLGGMTVDSGEPNQTAGATKRKLKHSFAGEDIILISNLENAEDQTSAIKTAGPLVFFEVAADPAPKVAPAVSEAIALTVNTDLPLDAVIELLDFICEDGDFRVLSRVAQAAKADQQRNKQAKPTS